MAPKHWLHENRRKFLAPFEQAFSGDEKFDTIRLNLHIFHEHKMYLVGHNGYYWEPIRLTIAGSRCDQDAESFHDAVLSALAPLIRSNALQGLQFLDFTSDSPRRATSTQQWSGEWALDVHVMLSVSKVAWEPPYKFDGRIYGYGDLQAFDRKMMSDQWHSPESEPTRQATIQYKAIYERVLTYAKASRLSNGGPVRQWCVQAIRSFIAVKEIENQTKYSYGIVLRGQEDRNRGVTIMMGGNAQFRGKAFDLEYCRLKSGTSDRGVFWIIGTISPKVVELSSDMKALQGMCGS